jgi:hypothetical protein
LNSFLFVVPAGLEKTLTGSPKNGNGNEASRPQLRGFGQFLDDVAQALFVQVIRLCGHAATAEKLRDHRAAVGELADFILAAGEN